MELDFISPNLIKGYKPLRKYNKSINLLIDSIKDFGFINPILITKDYELISGEARLTASLKCKLEKIPCIIIDTLTDDQVKAYRILDNQISEFTLWNYNEKNKEIKSIEMNLVKYGLPEDYIEDVNIDDFFEKNGHPQITLFDEGML